MGINKNLGNLMKEAQKMQQRMQEAQKQLSELVVEGVAGGDLVKIKMNGQHMIVDLKIKPAALDEDDVEMLEDLIKAAFHDAVYKIEKVSKDKITKLTEGLNIPTDLMDEDKE